MTEQPVDLTAGIEVVHATESATGLTLGGLSAEYVVMNAAMPDLATSVLYVRGEVQGSMTAGISAVEIVATGYDTAGRVIAQGSGAYLDRDDWTGFDTFEAICMRVQCPSRVKVHLRRES